MANQNKSPVMGPDLVRKLSDLLLIEGINQQIFLFLNETIAV